MLQVPVHFPPVAWSPIGERAGGFAVRTAALRTLRLVRARLLKSGLPGPLRTAALRHEERRVRNSPFYRTYPYDGAIAIRAVDLRTIVDVENRLLYHRITKNGGSSLAASMEMLIRGGAAMMSTAERRRLKKQALNPSHLSRRSATGIAGYFKFLIARNPFDRALSAYLSKVVKRYPNLPQDHPQRAIDPASEAKGMPARFAAFCEYLADGGLYDNIHWSPQADFLVFPAERYDFIAHLETIDRDFQVIANRIGAEAPSGMLKEDLTHATTASARRKQFYDGDLYRLVADLYRRDFDTFGYSLLDF